MNGELVNLERLNANSLEAPTLRSRLCQQEFEGLLKKYNCRMQIEVRRTYLLGERNEEQIVLTFVPVTETPVGVA